jgi:hypothetical protein
MSTQLAMPSKGTSWVTLVSDVPLNGPDWETDKAQDHGIPFPHEKRTSIRPAISGRVKLLYPDRVYTANEELCDERYPELEGQLVLMVRRIE